MPTDRLDPTWLDVVATQLTRSSTAALEASHELQAHYGDTGDGPTQQAVDTLTSAAADALAALTESFADSSRALRQAAGRQAAGRQDEGRQDEGRQEV